MCLFQICYFRLRHKAKAREQRNLVSAHCLTENDIDTKEDLDSLKPVDLDEDSQGGENNELHEKPVSQEVIVTFPIYSYNICTRLIL